MKKIIVPVDFSEPSELALQSAAAIAKQQNSELVVVHMLELSNAVITQTHNVSQDTVFYLKLAEKRFNEFLDQDYLKGIKITPIIKHYKIFSELNDLAKEEEAHLIVMGSNGVSGLKEIFIGSNTEKVVRNSSVPVLVIKNKPVTNGFDKAVFACDFSDDDIEPYNKAKDLLKKLDCKLHLLHVNTPDGKFLSTKERKQKVADFLLKVNENSTLLSDVIFVSNYSVEKGILEYANDNNVELIIMATHGRKGIAHFFEGSISEDVANHADLPVMTFKI